MYDDLVDDFITVEEITEAEELILAHAQRWVRGADEACSVFEEAIRKILKSSVHIVSKDKVIN